MIFYLPEWIMGCGLAGILSIGAIRLLSAGKYYFSHVDMSVWVLVVSFLTVAFQFDGKLLDLEMLFLLFFAIITFLVFSNYFFSIEHCFLFISLILAYSFTMKVDDIFGMYLGLEIAALCSYVFAASGLSRLELEAAIKYFSLNAIGSVLLLWGVSVLYFITGHSRISEFAVYFQFIESTAPFDLSFFYQNLFSFLGVILFSFALLLKLAAFPFYNWAVDVYSGVSYPVLLIFMVVSKFVVVCLLLKIYFVFEYSLFGRGTLNALLLFIGVCSMFIGTLGALWTFKIKRFLAYGTISHVSYIVFGFIAAPAAFCYVVVYCMLLIGIFIIFSAHGNLRELGQLSGVFNKFRFETLFLAISFFSLGGIPPFIGFFSKYLVFVGLINAGYVLLSLFILLASAISCFYYIRVVKLMFFDEAYAIKLDLSIFWKVLLGVIVLLNSGGFLVFDWLVNTVNSLVLLN